MVWRTLGRTKTHVSPYTYGVSLILTDNNLGGVNQFHVQVSACHRDGLGTEFTELRTENITEHTEYVGNPSLLDKLLRRAEKRTVGPAEYVVRTAMAAAKTETMRLEADLDQGFDPDEFNHQLETLFPVSKWANVPQESESTTTGTRRLVADGGRFTTIDAEWCDWCQHELQQSPEYRVHGTHVTAYCCSQACAKAWRASNTGDIVRSNTRVARADGSGVAPLVDPGTLEDAVDTWGVAVQSVIAIEELSELTTELAGRERWPVSSDRRPSDHDVLEELADARIMVDQLALIYGQRDFEKHVSHKLDRLNTLLAGDLRTDGGEEGGRGTYRVTLHVEYAEVAVASSKREATQKVRSLLEHGISTSHIQEVEVEEVEA